MSVVAGPRPDMGQVVLGGILETLGILIIVLPPFLAHGELRFEMPWVAVGGVFVVVGSVIALKALFDARRVQM